MQKLCIEHEENRLVVVQLCISMINKKGYLMKIALK